MALYPQLKRNNPAMALGAVVFRGIEGLLHLLIGISYLTMISMARLPETESSELLMRLSLSNIESIVLAAALVWAVGAILYYAVFLRQDLLPRWLSLWGIAGMLVCLASAILSHLCVFGPQSVPALLMNAPIALQEMALAVWLIVKGLKDKPTLRSDKGQPACCAAGT